MRVSWLIWLVVAMACSKKADAPKAGSGSPGPGPAVVADAAGAAPVAIDAAAADTGSAAVPDAKLAAIPEGGILLAGMGTEQLLIAKLDRSGLKVQHTQEATQATLFGWLDAQTLVVKHPRGKTGKPVVMKIVDGKPTEEVELDEEWDHDIPLLVTKSGEVWVERCVKPPDGPGDCKKLAFRRVYPSKKLAKKRPKDVDAERITGGYGLSGDGGVRAVVAAPADTKLGIVPVVVKDVGLDITAELVGVKCIKGAATSTYPGEEWDTAYGHTAKATRWVLADPPIYELRADVEDPVGQIGPDIRYFKPCEPKPLDAFISLGGPVWGEYVAADDDKTGSWTFRVGTTDVGTLDATALRANR